MLKHIAQDIAVAASNIIGYSVLITGKDSIVLGATNPERVGTLHEASIKVIRTGQQLVHDERQAAQLKGTKPGTTLPIVIGDEVVGSIGISGDPEDVARYGLLIKMMAGVFLRDRLELESAQLQEQRKLTLLRELVTFDEVRDNLQGLINRGQFLGYDLTRVRAAVLIQTEEKGCPRPEGDAGLVYGTSQLQRIKGVYNGKQDIVVTWRANSYLVFAAASVGRCEAKLTAELKELLRRKSGILAQQFAAEGVEAFMGVGNPVKEASSMKKTYEEAEQALYVARTRNADTCICADDIFLERLLMGMPENLCTDYVKEKIGIMLGEKNSQEMMELIVHWCESKFNFAQTARLLNIHKNTLDYRFKKINSILGVDLQNFNDALAMYMVITIYRMKGRYW